MADFAVHWVDAFTDRPFGGNGCAVVHHAAHLDDETCLAFVRETSLVECTFLGPSDVADVRVRYFLASREIPFAGHPTVASVVAAHAAGTIGTGDVTLGNFSRHHTRSLKRGWQARHDAPDRA